MCIHAYNYNLFIGFRHSRGTSLSDLPMQGDEPESGGWCRLHKLGVIQSRR